MRAALDKTVGTFDEHVQVRRRTIHVAPAAVQAAEQEQKAQEGKILTQGNRVGRSWSRWINEARQGGWNHPDSQITDQWISLMERLRNFDVDRRLAIITAVGQGMGLEGDYIFRGTPANNNKIAYVVNTLTSKRRYLAIGQGLPFDPDQIASGRFFTLSVGHLSGLEDHTDSLDTFRGSITDRFKAAAGQPIGLNDIYSAISEWIGKPQARVHFYSQDTID